MSKLCIFYNIVCKDFNPPKEGKLKRTLVYPKVGGIKFY